LKYAFGRHRVRQLSLANTDQNTARRKPLPKTKNGHSAEKKRALSQTLIEVLGRDAAEQIITVFGGARIWIPAQSLPTATLAHVIGYDAASMLCLRFGGDYLQIPNTIPEHGLQHRIADLHRQGYSINEIALAVGRSRRTVFRLLRRKINEFRRPAGFECQAAAR
jgi:Helix-turn-helix domain